MPNRDGTGPRGEGAGTGRGKGPCVTEKQLGPRSKDTKETTEKQLEKTRKGLGPCGDGTPRGGGQGRGQGGQGGRRKGSNGITYFT